MLAQAAVWEEDPPSVHGGLVPLARSSLAPRVSRISHACGHESSGGKHNGV